MQGWQLIIMIVVIALVLWIMIGPGSTFFLNQGKSIIYKSMLVISDTIGA
ncbi:MAG: hypothetical protein GOU99_00880 [Candidatus Altiarchaeota archaeon]|nr:hypothetical protein [Candidatus Altiarchaeota archaeon]